MNYMIYKLYNSLQISYNICQLFTFSYDMKYYFQLYEILELPYNIFVKLTKDTLFFYIL